MLYWDFARFINHSCVWNYAVTPWGAEIACRYIARGEELTNDYALERDLCMAPAVKRIFNAEHPLWPLLDDGQVELLKKAPHMPVESIADLSRDRRFVVLGLGGVARATLPLMFEILKLVADQVSILYPEAPDGFDIERYGSFERIALTKTNYRDCMSVGFAPGDVVLSLAWKVHRRGGAPPSRRHRQGRGYPGRPPRFRCLWMLLVRLPPGGGRGTAPVPQSHGRRRPLAVFEHSGTLRTDIPVDAPCRGRESIYVRVAASRTGGRPHAL